MMEFKIITDTSNPKNTAGKTNDHPQTKQKVHFHEIKPVESKTLPPVDFWTNINPELDPDTINKIKDVLEANKEAFALSIDDLEGTDTLEFDLELKPGARQIVATPAKLSKAQEDFLLEKFLQPMLKKKFIVPMTTPGQTHCLLCPPKKTTGQF